MKTSRRKAKELELGDKIYYMKWGELETCTVIKVTPTRRYLDNWCFGSLGNKRSGHYLDINNDSFYSNSFFAHPGEVIEAELSRNEKAIRQWRDWIKHDEGKNVELMRKYVKELREWEEVKNEAGE